MNEIHYNINMSNIVSYKELLLISIVGLLQPITEFTFGEKIAAQYNVLAAIIIILYLIFRIKKEGRSIWKIWGFRLDNLKNVLPMYISFGIIGSIILLLYGWYANTLPVPFSFWYLIALYPIWGLAQQFALQNLVAKNLV